MEKEPAWPAATGLQAQHGCYLCADMPATSTPASSLPLRWRPRRGLLRWAGRDVCVLHGLFTLLSVF
jgi:CelD/BcsL family acetyltransferase involved in cellulose biosynthesis